MPLSVRKGITVAFLLVSTIFMIIVGYTTNLYFAVYTTIRNFDASIPKLNMKVVNSSYILIKTPITIQNPSECTLEITQIIEGLWLEGKYILTESLYTHGNPIQLYPASTINVTVEAKVPSHRIQYVMARLEKSWVVNTRIFLMAPIAGTFSWQNSSVIRGVTLIETSS